MYFRLYATLLSAAFLLLSASFKKECRHVGALYSNGKPKSVIVSNCDNPSSFVKTAYFANGQRCRQVMYVNGVENGAYTNWYINGNLATEGTMLNGRENGRMTCWYENGNRKLTCTYNHGIKMGAQYTWYENGNLKSEGMYVDGREEGVWKIFTEHNGMYAKSIKKQDRNGRKVEYIASEEGIMKIVTGQDKNKDPEGIWKLYDKEHNLVQMAIFHKNMLNADFIQFHTNGNVSAQGRLTNGFYDGAVKYYDADGKFTGVKKYVQGSPATGP